jgi:hypothetical protein
MPSSLSWIGHPPPVGCCPMSRGHAWTPCSSRVSLRLLAQAVSCPDSTQTWFRPYRTRIHPFLRIQARNHRLRIKAMEISGRVPVPQDKLSPNINGAPVTPFLARKPSCRFLRDPPPTSCRLEACRAKKSTEGGSPSCSTAVGRIIRAGGPLELRLCQCRVSRRGVHRCENELPLPRAQQSLGKDAHMFLSIFRHQTSPLALRSPR